MSVDEWDDRTLCPDGGCTGVIGADGLCKTCGKVMPGWGLDRTRGLDTGPVEKSDPDEDDDADDDDDDDDADDDLQPDTPSETGDWAQRELCNDGSCVGVIGDDGVCSVCRKPPEAA